jgi:photosystem II stability/assembly factor-like uncharacterized protein
MKKIFVGLLFLIMASPIFASTQTGKVKNIMVRSDGLHWIYLDTPRGDRPDCSKNHTYWMIKDEESTYGKSQFSLLLTAYASGKTVHIVGTGDCHRWGDGEDIHYIQLQ